MNTNDARTIGTIQTAIELELRRQADVDENGVLFVTDYEDQIVTDAGTVLTIDGDVNLTKLAIAAFEAARSKA